MREILVLWLLQNIEVAQLQVEQKLILLGQITVKSETILFQEMLLAVMRTLDKLHQLINDYWKLDTTKFINVVSLFLQLREFNVDEFSVYLSNQYIIFWVVAGSFLRCLYACAFSFKRHLVCNFNSISFILIHNVLLWVRVRLISEMCTLLKSAPPFAKLYLCSLVQCKAIKCHGNTSLFISYSVIVECFDQERHKSSSKPLSGMLAVQIQYNKALLSINILVKQANTKLHTLDKKTRSSISIVP